MTIEKFDVMCVVDFLFLLQLYLCITWLDSIPCSISSFGILIYNMFLNCAQVFTCWNKIFKFCIVSVVLCYCSFVC